MSDSEGTQTTTVTSESGEEITEYETYTVELSDGSIVTTEDSDEGLTTYYTDESGDTTVTVTNSDAEITDVYSVDESSYELTETSVYEAVIGSTLTEYGSYETDYTTSCGSYLFVLYDNTSASTVDYTDIFGTKISTTTNTNGDILSWVTSSDGITYNVGASDNT